MTSHHIPPTQDPNDTQDLLPAYAIGATDPAESARVVDYLRQHPEAASKLAEYATAATLLTGGIARRDPPAALRQKLLDAARAQRQTAPTPARQAIPFPSNRTVRAVQRPLLAWLSTAAAVVLLVMNVFWMSQVNELRARQADLERTNQDQLAALAQANQAQLTALEQASHAQMNDAVTIMVSGTKSELMDESGQMRAMVMWQPGDSEAVMFTHSLPTLDNARTYQLWMIDDAGAMVSAGTFSVDSEGRATLMFDAQTALDAFNGFGISVEPMGGSPSPTTAPLALSAL